VHLCMCIAGILRLIGQEDHIMGLCWRSLVAQVWAQLSNLHDVSQRSRSSWFLRHSANWCRPKKYSASTSH